MDDSSQDKHLPATQRKIDKSRRDGQVARSRDLGHLGALGGGVALLAAFAAPFADRTRELLRQGLRFDAHSLTDPAQMTSRLSELGLQMVTLLAPLFAVVVMVALASGVLAGGWNFTFKPLEPKFSKLNPLTGLGRVFSGQQLIDALKASFLAIVLGSVGALYMGQRWMKHAELLSMPLPAALAAGAQLIFEGLLLVAGVLAIFALVDVPLQRQLHLRRMRMSVEEMKKEYKEVEGNAEVKAQLKARMREAANRRSLAAVPQADLVVMNPTHYAVALKYDESRMAAPRVIAKGADLMALRIRDLARDSKVPVLQSPSLARALYAHTEVDQEVPARLFSAVAQVLAWVYQLRDAVAAGKAANAPPPTPVVPPDMDPANDRPASDDAASRKEPEL